MMPGDGLLTSDNARRFGAGAVPQQVDRLISRRRDQPGARGGEGGAGEDAGPRDLLELLMAAWIPFGGGKRGCIGAGFARMEAVLVRMRLTRRG